MKSADKSISVRIKSITEVEKNIEEKELPEDVSIEMRLGSEMGRAEEQDFYIRMKVLYMYENRPIVTYTVEYMYEFEDIESVFEFTDVIKDKTGVLPTMTAMVISGLRGMLALRLENTPYQHYILPYADPAMFVKNMKKEE